MQFFVNSVPVCGDTVPLGVQGENLATQITADVSGWLDQWPDGQVIVRLIDANRQSHLADTVVSDGTLVWIVTAADTAQGGYGVGVIELVQGDVVKKSEPFATRVITDPAASGEAPEPVPGWVEETIARMEELEAGAAQSAGAAQTSAGSAQTSAQSAQAAAAQAAQSAEDSAAVLPQVETAGAAQVTAIQAAGQQQTQAVTAAGAQQVSAVQTEGADQRAAVQTAGAAQVTAIQAEGQTQQTAIQQKGADTLASIPADYTELSDDVAELKSQMDEKADKDETPKCVDTDADAVDLDVTDENGNVLMRLKDGHLQTKRFDSTKTAAVVPTDATDSDIDLVDGQGNVVVRFANGHIQTKKFNSASVENAIQSPETEGVTGQFLGIDDNNGIKWLWAKKPIDLFIDNVDVDYKFDESTNANYTVIRVYKDTIQGTKQFPFVFAPNGAEPPTGSNKSTYTMNTEYGFVMALNAGIFNTSNGYADGILIMNGIVYQDSPSTTSSECKPLWIDQNGDLHSADYNVTASELLSQGCVSAVCGFMPIVVDYDPVPSSAWNNVSHYYDNAQRQIIGQFGNGDYAIVTCEGRSYQNSDGWTIAEAQKICQEIGLKFAYNLDGGGSTETMIGLKHINTIYDGTYGRKVPTFIVFNGTAIPPANPII